MVPVATKTDELGSLATLTLLIEAQAVTVKEYSELGSRSVIMACIVSCGRVENVLIFLWLVTVTLYRVSEELGTPGIIGSVHDRFVQVGPNEFTCTFRGLDGGPARFLMKLTNHNY